MDYTLIKGTFHVVGHSPDGDSIKFKANNDARWERIPTKNREKLEEALSKEDGVLQLRLQAIDALETHYSPPYFSAPKELKGKEVREERPDGGKHKQPSELADAATDGFLEMLGVKRVEWRSWGQAHWISKAYFEKRGKEICIEKKYEDEIPGYIVTNDVEKNGRPISWIFAGTTRKRDGSKITPQQLADIVAESANYHLLRQGLVYPYFYMSLPAVVRTKLAQAVQLAQAEAAKLLQEQPNLDELPEKLPNLWLHDKTLSGAKLTTISKINDEYEIWPYLFRKILKHWHRTNLEEYWESLRNEKAKYTSADENRIKFKNFFGGGNPYILIVSETNFVKLDQVLEIKGSTLKMTAQLWDIVFLS